MVFAITLSGVSFRLKLALESEVSADAYIHLMAFQRAFKAL